MQDPTRLPCYKDESAHFKMGFMLEALRGIRYWLQIAINDPRQREAVVAAQQMAEDSIEQMTGERREEARKSMLAQG